MLSRYDNYDLETGEENLDPLEEIRTIWWCPVCLYPNIDTGASKSYCEYCEEVVAEIVYVQPKIFFGRAEWPTKK